MFNFFKRGKTGRPEPPAETAEGARTHESAADAPVAANPHRHTSERTNTLRKDVVNLLIPETDYGAQRGGVGAIFQNIMAGGRKRKNRKRKNIARAESCREISPQKEMHGVTLQRSHSELDPIYKRADVTSRAEPDTENTSAIDAPREPANDADPANFVKALVLQKYANKPPVQQNKQHVSLVYVSNEPDIDERQHAETLLREIARSIDCSLDSGEFNTNKPNVMGATDSKAVDRPRVSGRNERRAEPVYETVDEAPKSDSIKAFKNDLRDELEKLLQEQKKETDAIKEDASANEDVATTATDNKPLPDILESPMLKKKSNLKPPKSDTEGCSDDDRSDCGKKKVTFRKHIVFDDGDQQTDDEVNSSFASLTSSEGSEEDVDEEEEEEDSEAPDNDELLGGVVVARNEDSNNAQENVKPDPPSYEAAIKDKIINGDASIKIKVECDDDGLKRISSDNSDSGFLEFSDKCDLTGDGKTLGNSDSSSSEVTDSEESEEEVEISIEEEVIAQIIDPDKGYEDGKNLVSQESKFQSQVAHLTELADARSGESERMRDQICRYRKEIEAKDQEIEHLKCQLAAAYKESELVRQRSRSLEEELGAARSCSADLAGKLSKHNELTERQLRSQLEDSLNRSAELESRVLGLERDRDRLEQEKMVQEQRAQEAVSAAEATTAKWRAAHEAARSQAAARAERMLADCEWKMRELEKRARDTDKTNRELTKTIDQLKSEASQGSEHVAELDQLRGLAGEQQRSVQALRVQLETVESRERALDAEVERLRGLLEGAREREERHAQTVARLQSQHSDALEATRAELQARAAGTRAALERTHAERTRAALAQLRADAERDARNADRKLREVTTRFDSLKETLTDKQELFERTLSEARSKADWELLQLRHLLDKSDINYANSLEKANDKFERETESLIAEWQERLRAVEQQAATAADDAKKLLETTRLKLTAEKNDQINKLKEQHRKEMDEQWEQFMSDKESCLARMKTECRQEGEEERVERERDLLEEIAELKSQIQSKACDFDSLAIKAAACGRTLAVTEQELREALAREKELREKRSQDATKIKQVERASKDQIEHLTRKCACLRKLFDDMRARLTVRERTAEQETKAREREVHQLRAEVARLTKILVEQGSPKLGARTRADGCDAQAQLESFLSVAAPLASETQPCAPRRKGGTGVGGRPRAHSVDLPPVQVPVRVRQLEQKNQIS